MFVHTLRDGLGFMRRNCSSFRHEKEAMRVEEGRFKLTNVSILSFYWSSCRTCERFQCGIYSIFDANVIALKSKHLFVWCVSNSFFITKITIDSAYLLSKNYRYTCCGHVSMYRSISVASPIKKEKHFIVFFCVVQISQNDFTSWHRMRITWVIGKWRTPRYVISFPR